MIYNPLWLDLQDSVLSPGSLKIEVIDSLKYLIVNIKAFEIENPRKYRKRVNRWAFDIIKLFNTTDTVLLFDTEFTEIHRMIRNNLK